MMASFEDKRACSWTWPSDYADTMYHLGAVMYLEGKENDSETLIRNSISILEEGGQVESFTCLRRLRYLSRILLKSNRLTERLKMSRRRIPHIMELSKGRKSLGDVIAVNTALTLQSNGNLKEAKEFLQRAP
ncbi:hypothetical protein IFM89_009074 [Coptis chinensis]|uniref:Uncharacterized protein n=1 Tax=Coptis chinensis TaxID=261450 RepID=A0A835M7Y4_9MAGN|nr:hypothetical protein IFM89_009074 [Coptis chinensis]